MNLPDQFVQQITQQLGSESEAFFQSLTTPPPVSIHLNPKKVFPIPKLEHVPWNKNGYYLPFRPVFTLDPLFHAGAYYVQEASSMFVAEVLRQCVDLNEDLNVLDLAAAPGGKTVALASILSKGSILLSNEVIHNRYQILKQNIAKWGYSNVFSSNHDAQGLSRIGSFFDVILVDAPCSGEGLFRRDSKAAQEWSPDNVHHCTARQKKILADTIQLLKPGGLLLYSTCTFNSKENEENAIWLSKEFGFQALELELPHNWGITKRSVGYQFYPHKTKGEGFYLACFRKEGAFTPNPKSKKPKSMGLWQKVSKNTLASLSPWIDPEVAISAFLNEKTGQIFILPKHLEERTLTLASNISKIQLGTPLGILKQQKLVPDPAWAFSLSCSKEVPRVTLDELQALHFLKKDKLPNESIPKGWQRIQFENHGLGWVKGLGNRVNNYYPNHWRILMNIPELHEGFWRRLR